jgi:predicted dehydrogenase
MPIRIAVVGAGAFGRNHLRVLKQNPRAELVALVDPSETARAAASEFGCAAFADHRELPGKVDAAVVAAPTTLHAEIGEQLLAAGLDVLVEKPIASDLEGARRLVAAAETHSRILQVGHLERFNPAVTALEAALTLPLFFEIHRLSVFSPRSLDVDVVLDLMIHDLEILLALTGQLPEEIRAAGIRILSEKVDIANVRLAFPNGCIANLTASRVSTERVRKIRLFQPQQYISLDYAKQEAVRFSVSPPLQIGFGQLPVTKGEPLARELDHFLDCIERRARPKVGGPEALRALEVALEILDKIEAHRQVIVQTLATNR